MATMQHLFSPLGEAALAIALGRRPLLAFDFDGTLAPIVARPESARISSGVSARLQALNSQLPVAIVTGRAVADVRARLDFSPAFVIGNHGAEDDAAAPEPLQPASELAPLREVLRAQGQALQALGVTVEDKRLSIALHYRLSRQREQALAAIRELLAPFGPGLHVFAGKMVVNVSPANAPDKADAVHALVARCGADCAVFAGDDVNDEPVFASAPADWLTVRVGRDDPHSRARYFLDGPNEVALMLDHMLAILSPAQRLRG